jgi:hypothetical protein
MGRFKNLKMKHLIGIERLSIEYFTKLIEWACYSNVFLYYYHNIPQQLPPRTIWAKIRSLKNYIAKDRNEKLCEAAVVRGQRNALKEIRLDKGR